MKIVAIHIVAFGKLKNVNLQFKNGLNVLQNSNGFGKTTLASFIRAMLYGFTYTRAKGATDASHFAPWGSTEKFGGSMVVEHCGEIYRIERFFGATARQESAKFINEKTGKEVNIQVQPGEFLLGLTADSYDRSAYFPQEAVELSSNDNFEARLANLVQDGAEDYDKVQDRLRNYKKNLRYERGNGGKIYELTCEKQRLLQQQANAQAAERRSVEIERRLREIAGQKAKLERRYADYNERLVKPRLQQTTQVIEQSKQQQQPRVNKFAVIAVVVLAIIGVLFVVLGVMQTLTKTIALGIGVGAFALSVLVLILLFVRRAIKKRRLKDVADNQSGTVVSDGDTADKYLEDIQRCVQTISELSTEEGRLIEERKNLVFDSVAIQDKILAVDQQRLLAQHQYEVADAVVKLLEQAKDNLSSSYLPRLCERSSQLLKEITQSNLSVVVDRNFTVSIREQGQTKPMGEFSRGIREIALLCFRVALSELLYDGAIPFVIIDDAFVNFDEQNFLRATTLLKKLATHAQVIYFTCHNRTGNLHLVGEASKVM